MPRRAVPDRDLIYYGARPLREPCRPVTPGEPGLRELIDQMRRIMIDHDGVGLAAPQVGEPVRVFLAHPPENRNRRPLVFLNPEPLSLSIRHLPFEEGCLSFPGIYRQVVRPAEVSLGFQDLSGVPRRLKTDGLLARIIQHEMDHLDGVLLVDHLKGWTKMGVKLRMGWRGLSV
ncbi:peptide deformylase [bacterium]|nr:peptide deformylase [bacterium]